MLELKNTLLEGGIAFTYVKRFIEELEDHYSDLQQESISQGNTREQAHVSSAKQLGSLPVLAEEMLKQPEIKRFSYRFPKTTMVFGPCIIFILLGALMLLSVVAAMSIYMTLFAEGDFANFVDLSPPQWLEFSSTGIRFFLMYLLTPLLALTFSCYAIRNRVLLKYFGSGLVMLCLLGNSLSIAIAWGGPAAVESGLVGVAVNFETGVYLLWRFAATIGFLLMMATLLYWLRQQRTLV